MQIVTAIYEMIGSKGGGASEVIVDRIFAEMDTDGDGVLSLSEFVQVLVYTFVFFYKQH